MTTTRVTFECPECEHEWSGTQQPPTGHQWETCPNCGADDGENCWDCGESMEDKDLGGEMCSKCRRTLCWDCTGGQFRSSYSPHSDDGRKEDKGRCGETARVL
jgi:hypothetical protein